MRTSKTSIHVLHTGKDLKSMSRILQIHNFEFLIFMWKCKFIHCAGFLLLCMTTFAPQTIENLRMHKLTLPHENVTFSSHEYTKVPILYE